MKNVSCHTDLLLAGNRIVDEWDPGLILAVVKLKTFQVTKLPLWHEIRKIGMICFAKSLLTAELYIVQKE
jgi:hypothetical protein